jgi:hypothetical protein
MTRGKSKQDQAAQRQMDKWADLMQRIAKNPEIADRIPNDANLLFTEGDVIFINGEPRRYSELVRVDRKRKTTKSKRPKKSKKDAEIQRHVDRWADLMTRIIKNPEIADRIPNHANLFFLNDEVVLINGEPRRYSELVKVQRGKKKTAKGKKQTARAIK